MIIWPKQIKKCEEQPYKQYVRAWVRNQVNEVQLAKVLLAKRQLAKQN